MPSKDEPFEVTIDCWRNVGTGAIFETLECFDFLRVIDLRLSRSYPRHLCPQPVLHVASAEAIPVVLTAEVIFDDREQLGLGDSITQSMAIGLIEIVREIS